MNLVLATEEHFDIAMGMINAAKAHLKAQGIDQWQTGYPDEACIHRDMANQKGYFIMDGEEYVGYLVADFDGEPAYKELRGEWKTDEKYMVVHRMAFSDAARGKGISTIAFKLAEDLAVSKGVHAFRVDTDEDNKKMKYILDKAGFTYRGTIWFDNSEKIAYDKVI